MNAEYSVEDVRKQVELRRCFQSLEVFKGSQHTFGEAYDHPEGCFVRWEDVEKFLSTHPHAPDAADSGRVTDEVVDAALFSETTDEYGEPTAMLIDFMGMGSTEKLGLARRSVRAAIEAALAAQGQGEAVATLARLARHADDCLSHNVLPTGAGNWHCDCGYDRYVLDGEPTDACYTAPPASPAGVPDVRLQAEIHKVAKRFLSKKKQGYFMQAIREMLAAAPSATPEGGEVGL